MYAHLWNVTLKADQSKKVFDRRPTVRRSGRRFPHCGIFHRVKTKSLSFMTMFRTCESVNKALVLERHSSYHSQKKDYGLVRITINRLQSNRASRR